MNDLTIKGIESTYGNGGAIEYKIDHTSRSWGIDIENLIMNQINTIIEKPKKILEFVVKNGIMVSGIISFIVTFSLYSIAYEYIKHLKDVDLINVNGTLNKFGTDLSGKLNYLIKNVASGIITYVMLFIWLVMKFDITEESHILLTEEAKKYKNREDKKTKTHWRTIVIGLIVSMLTGVAGNFIYAYLIK